MTESNAPSRDVKDLLVAASIGTFGASTGWGIFIGREPPEPDSTVTIYDTPGDAPNPKWLLDEPRFQVRIRAKTYELAWAKAEAVKRALLGLPSQTVNGTVYVGIWLVSDTGFLMQDELNRTIFVQTYRIIREPNSVSGNHRRPL